MHPPNPQNITDQEIVPSKQDAIFGCLFLFHDDVNYRDKRDT